MPDCGTVASGLGLFLALMALVFIVVEISIQSFVEVFLVTELDGDSFTLSDEPIAGLGVFQTSYDPSVLDDAILAASGIPDEAQDSGTTEFPLLFPAQENFVLDVLPIQRDDIEDFEEAFGSAAGVLLDSLLKPIEDLEFTSCEEYIPEAEAKLETFFNSLNNGLLPSLNGILFADLFVGLDDAFAGLLDGFGSESDIFNGLVNLTLTFTATARAGVAQTPGCEFIISETGIETTLLNAGAKACYANAYGGTVAVLQATNPELSAFLTDVSTFINSCSETDTLSDCFDKIDTIVEDNVGVFPIAFNGTGTPLCDVWSGCDSSTTTIEFYVGTIPLFEDILGLVTASNPNPDEDTQELIAGLQGLIQASQAYSASVAFQVVSPLTPLGDIVSADLLPSTFPTTSFNEFYVPCAMLQLASVFENSTLPSLSQVPGVCPFSGYFNVLVESALASADTDDDELIPLIAQLDFLYGICESLGKAPIVCGDVFAAVFMSGAYSRGLNTTVLAFSADNAPVFAEALVECEEDAEDKEIISQAQGIVITAVAFACLAIIFGLLACVLEQLKLMLLLLACICEFLSFVLNIAALFTARTAPVFEVVGEDPTILFEPVYVTGSVITFAGVALACAILSTIAFAAAAVAQCMGGGSDDMMEQKPSV